jgi:peptidoglycan/LPS O-acetylase OafA/YrhL
LISRSFEKTNSITDYVRNRSLRIFPALHVCVLLNIIAVAVTGYFATVGAGFFDVLFLYLAKTTFFQFYNPDFMRQFGDGVLNGSLWTICVELQFYLLTPVIYKACVSARKTSTNLALLAIITGSLVCNRYLYASQPDYGDSNYWKIFRVSFLPWLYMFVCGMVVQINFSFFAKTLRSNLFVLALPGYIIFAYFMRKAGFRLENSVSPFIFIPLVMTVFIAAFSAPTLARKLLKGNDISYGIYIYHVPIMNMLLFYGFRESVLWTSVTLAPTILCALVSWFMIERPSLAKKHKAARPIALDSDACQA